MLRIVHLILLPGQADRFVQIFENHRPKVLDLKGCNSITLARDQDNPLLFMTLSEWQSSEDLHLYRTSSLFLDVWKKVKPLFAEKARVQNLQVLSSNILKARK